MSRGSPVGAPEDASSRGERICCFRFDADTHRCVVDGIPRLLELGETMGARFTFFVNMGRAFDHRITLAKWVRRRVSGGPRDRLPMSGKLGFLESLRAALLNPRCGASHPDILRQAARLGHEIGLHGGVNHATWEAGAHTWDTGRLRAEVVAGLEWLDRCGLASTTRSFASPAWNSPPGLVPILRGLGFQVIADTLDPSCDGTGSDGGILSVPTNITPARGTCGYLEASRLAGWSRSQLIADFRRQLASKRRLAVVYDHPCHAGVAAREDLADLIRAARHEGFVIRTIAAAAGLGAPLPATTGGS